MSMSLCPPAVTPLQLTPTTPHYTTLQLRDPNQKHTEGSRVYAQEDHSWGVSLHSAQEQKWPRVARSRLLPRVDILISARQTFKFIDRAVKSKSNPKTSPHPHSLGSSQIAIEEVDYWPAVGNTLDSALDRQT